jgi:lipoprotein-releasing system ATP-binding protein
MLKAINLHKVYHNGSKKLHVLKGVNLEVEREEFLAIVGPSGAGKSTLLHILGGLDEPSDGKVIFVERNLYALSEKQRAQIRNREIGFVFQFYHLLPEYSALENVLLPALIRSKKENRRELRQRAREILKEVGLAERIEHRPSQLSGGEAQRVAIARALINAPKLLLCDEPTGNLDSKLGEEIIKLLIELNQRQGLTIVIVSHDLKIAERAERIARIHDGVLFA